MSKFVKWNDLNQFHEVVKSLGHVRLYTALKEHDYKLTYGLKVKLHGTNAAVRIDPDGKVTAQKRSSDVKPGSGDNCGFAAWVASNEAYWANLARSNGVTVIYGEWAGPGIQSGVACSETNHKFFYVFAMDIYDDGNFGNRLVDPYPIQSFLDGDQPSGAVGLMPDDVIVIPWHSHIEIDFESKMETERALAQLNLLTEQCGAKDPLMAELFGIDGFGEGFVCYPQMGKEPWCYSGLEELEHFSHFNFKAKSMHHRVNKTKAAVNFDPEKFANKNRFADAFCTEQRMQQGFKDALAEEKDMKLTPVFIKWVCSDVFKESTTEREETGLDWKDLSKVVSARAAIWYKQRVMTA